MKKYIFLFFFLILSNFIFAQNPKTLISHPWKIDPTVIDEQIAAVGEDMDAIQRLEKRKNQTYTFTTKKKTNQVVIENDGTGTWKLDGTQLTITMGGEERSFRIMELSGARMRLLPAGQTAEIHFIAK